MSRLYGLLVLVALTGCASLTGEKVQPISVQTVYENTEVSRVGCSLMNAEGSWLVSTPGTAMISKSTSDLAVSCRKGKILAGDAIIVSKANGGMWGNLLVGGLIGYVVDSNSGAGFDYPTSITVQLRSFDAADVPGVTAASQNDALTAPKVAALTEQLPAAKEASSFLNPEPTVVARAPEPPETGPDSYRVTNIANSASCGSSNVAKLTTKGAGFELYAVTCANGDVWSYRCEFGNCRQLK